MEITNIKGGTYAILSPANVGLYVKNGAAMLIDSGSDPSAGRKILRLAEAEGWDIKLIVNTHFHADHIGGNAFESVIKVIAAQKGWDDVLSTDPAFKLIDALYRHELIPSWMQEQMKGLKSTLQGVPTVRNKEASHGAGETPRQVSKELAAYQLHQTAAAILFLISQAKLA